MRLEHEAGQAPGQEVAGQVEVVGAPPGEVRFDVDVEVVTAGDRRPRSFGHLDSEGVAGGWFARGHDPGEVTTVCGA
jgi:hypothetical protein